MRKPNKVIESLSRKARAKAIELIGEELYLEYFGNNGYTVYAVDQRRGGVKRSAKTCTIPRWCVERPETAAGITKIELSNNSLLKDYWIYYLAHEIAHVLSDDMSHGAVFMKKFIEICPEHLQFFELGYKPRNAKAAGIKNVN